MFDVNRIGGVWDTPTKKRQASGIFDQNGLMMALCAAMSNNGQPCIVVNRYEDSNDRQEDC